MMRSLRLRLVAILSVTVLLGWLATAFFSYIDTRREIGDMLGAHASRLAEIGQLRDALSQNVANHLMHPLAVAVPILAVLIWLSVRWGLSPLQRLADEVARRAPGALEPLGNKAEVPVEVRPLTEALDALFARTAALIERERRFTADAAHELRTPLAAIKTQAEVALGARDPAQARHAIEQVVRGTDRAARLVEQLLVLARLDPRSGLDTAQPVDLAGIAAEAISAAAPLAAGKKIDIGLSADPAEPPVVSGDAGLLAVLLRNLIDNAIRYTPENGRIDVSARLEEARAVLRVADNGPGIAAEERTRVLNRFYRVLGSGGSGSGLGLSIVARIAELHRAHLSLGTGLDGKGLSVTIAFPTP